MIYILKTKHNNHILSTKDEYDYEQELAKITTGFTNSTKYSNYEFEKIFKENFDYDNILNKNQEIVNKHPNLSRFKIKDRGKLLKLGIKTPYKLYHKKGYNYFKSWSDFKKRARI